MPEIEPSDPASQIEYIINQTDESTKGLREFFTELLENKDLISIPPEQFPFAIISKNVDVTETLIQSVAIGILLEQEKGTRHDSLNVTAPFGYFSPDEVLYDISYRPLRALLECVVSSYEIQGKATITVNEAVEDFDMLTCVATNSILGVMFGSALERSSLESAREQVLDM